MYDLVCQQNFDDAEIWSTWNEREWEEPTQNKYKKPKFAQKCQLSVTIN